MSRQVTLTRLLCVGATCEACEKTADVSARSNATVRYYCRDHVSLALRPILLAVRTVRP